MIIQCDHCSARFRMDDSKLANGPVKVRCAKCKEVFVVEPETVVGSSVSQAPPQAVSVVPAPPREPVVSDDFSFGTTSPSVESSSSSIDDFSFNVETPSLKSEVTKNEPDSADEFDWQSGTASSFVDSKATSDFDLSSFNASIEAPSSSATFSEGGDFDFGEVDFAAKSQSDEPSAANNDSDEFSMDFGAASFSDLTTDSDVSSKSSAGTPASAEPDFAELSKTLSAVEKSDDFVLSFNADTVQSGSTASVAKVAHDDVNFGEFSFGDIAETTAPAASFSVPVAENKSVEFQPSAVPDFPEYSEDDLPPSSLTTRKKSGSLFPVFVIAGAIVLIIALAGSGVYFFGGPKAFSKVGLGFLVEWYGDKAGEEGSIVIKGVTASYVLNSTAGELFVVRGEAVNNFKKPRASIQIKASLVGSGGSSLVTKSAFCGNSLSSEQLATLPLTKIEEIMNNQFGDSLANLGLKPGATIPFVVVVSPVPKEATDYTVVVGGSTVAAP
ncbi:MAG: zinc-ribbon domain-containing protein [Geobacteraceae bacterium]|nr:zinc-ribbon domain-containing protein [Geobacteraceae bacterium]